MEERKKFLSDFYQNQCDEDNRLIQQRYNKIEFLTTLKYVEKYLKKGDKILEVGAGTGRYSIHFANQGYDVSAIEYVEHNLEIFKSKIEGITNISAELGDAIDLSRFADNSFDVTLVLGPLYHLYTKADIEKAVSEAVRVTKKGGIIFFAYITSDSIFVNFSIKELINGRGLYFDDNFKMINLPEQLFSSFYIKEFKDLMSNYPIRYLKSVATNGISEIIKDKLENLTDEEFNVWLEYHFSTCEREDLQGYSSHMLYICEKNK